MHSSPRALSVLALPAAALPTPALANIGQGAGLGAVAVALAVVLGLVMLLIGLVWFPLKRAIARLRATPEPAPPISASRHTRRM